MSDRDDDLCYWDGEPINAMTREALQKALGDAVMIIEHKNDIIDCLVFKLAKNLSEKCIDEGSKYEKAIVPNDANPYFTVPS